MKIFNFGLMLVAFLLALWAAGCSTNPPSDKSMEENFRARRADFEKLAAMLKEDVGIEVIEASGRLQPFEQNANLASPAPTPKGPLPAQRLEEYRRLLRQVGVKNVRRVPGGVVFLAWEDGNSFYDLYIDPAKYRSKDYIFDETPPSPLLDTLEDPEKLQRDDYGASGYKKIAEGWYLRYITD